MCDPATAVMVGSTALKAVSSYGKASAQKQAAQYQAGIDQQNAAYSDLQAQDALARGEQAAREQQIKGRQMAGTQTADMAANGVRLDSATPLNILSDTQSMTHYDAQVIKQNAQREAYGYQMQGYNQRARAGMESQTARNTHPMLSAGTSLLSNAGPVASKWYRNRYAGVNMDSGGFTNGGSGFGMTGMGYSNAGGVA